MSYSIVDDTRTACNQNCTSELSRYTNTRAGAPKNTFDGQGSHTLLRATRQQRGTMRLLLPRAQEIVKLASREPFCGCTTIFEISQYVKFAFIQSLVEKESDTCQKEIYGLLLDIQRRALYAAEVDFHNIDGVAKVCPVHRRVEKSGVGKLCAAKARSFDRRT
eukprot:6177080-Pleurochrysis_carterae.AAC.5